jgi:hypothetical protein
MSIEKRTKKQPKKDGLYGRTPYMKYRNAQILLKKYVQDTWWKLTFQAREDLPLFNVKMLDWVPSKDIFEAIIISYSFEGIKGFTKLSEITDQAMARWILGYLHQLIRSDPDELYELYAGRRIQASDWAEIIEYRDEWKEMVKKSKGKLDYWRPSIEMLKIIGWNKMDRAEKIKFFEQYRHLEHYNGYILADELNMYPDKFEQYMDDLSHILEPTWDPDKY